MSRQSPPEVSLLPQCIDLHQRHLHAAAAVGAAVWTFAFLKSTVSVFQGPGVHFQMNAR